MSEVTIYTKTGCPYCAAARKHYDEQGIGYREINVKEVPGAESDVLRLTKGERIVPVIVVDDQVTIGFGGG